MTMAAIALAGFAFLTILYLVGIGMPGTMADPKQGRYALVATMVLFVVAAFGAANTRLGMPMMWLGLLALPLIGLVLVAVWAARPGTRPKLGRRNSPEDDGRR